MFKSFFSMTLLSFISIANLSLASWNTFENSVIQPIGEKISKIDKYKNYLFLLKTKDRTLFLSKSHDLFKTYDLKMKIGIDLFNGTKNEMKIDYQGNIHIFWVDEYNSLSYRRSITSGNKFENKKILCNNLSNISELNCFIINNTIYIVFKAVNGSQTDLFYIKSSNGGESFLQPIKITNDNIIEENPKIIVYKDDIFIAYFNKNFNDIYLSKININSHLSNIVKVNKDKEQTNADFDFFIDDNERINISYLSLLNDNKADIYIAKYSIVKDSFEYELYHSNIHSIYNYNSAFILNNNYYLIINEDNQIQNDLFIIQKDEFNLNKDVFNISQIYKYHEICDFIVDSNELYIVANTKFPNYGDLNVHVLYSIKKINDYPKLSEISDQIITENSYINSVLFNIYDENPDSLNIFAKSSNKELIADENIKLNFTYPYCTISLNPLTNKNGKSQISITVNDGTYSSSKSFLLTVLPLKPINRFPLDNAKDININTTLSWHIEKDFSNYKYDIYFGKDNNLVRIYNNVSSTTINPGLLENNTNYNWQVVSVGSEGVTNQSDIWSFTTTSEIDTDNDNIEDQWEIFNFGNLDKNGLQDSDFDGLNDLKEFKLRSNPNSEDTDNDQMDDLWEVNNLLDILHDDSNFDNDGDKFTNLREYDDKTNPNDSNSHFIIPEKTGRIPDIEQSLNSQKIITKNSYIINPHVFIKMDKYGNYLSDNAQNYVMVYDIVTGLTWEVKQNNIDSIHNKDLLIPWDMGANDNVFQNINGSNEINTSNYIKTLNANEFGSYSDWRLPDISELQTLISLANSDCSINKKYFKNSACSEASNYSSYWSATKVSGSEGFIWCVNFYDGKLNKIENNARLYIRAVRGKSNNILNNFIDNDDGTITDVQTGLMWLKDYIKAESFHKAITTCENLNYANYSNWRLPGISELLSTVDLKKHNPSINSIFFNIPEIKNSGFWSFNAKNNNENEIFFVEFYNGENLFINSSKENFYIDEGVKYFFDDEDSLYVRPVRGGQNLKADQMQILSPQQGSIWNFDDRIPIIWKNNGLFQKVNIYISREGGKSDSYILLFENIENTGYIEWDINIQYSYNCVIKIEPVNNKQNSSYQGFFAIKPENKAPVISEIENIECSSNAESFSITFNAIDEDTPQDLHFSLESSYSQFDSSLYTITYINNNNYSLKINSESFKSESASFTLLVNDGEKQAAQYFNVLIIDEEKPFGKIYFPYERQEIEFASMNNIKVHAYDDHSGVKKVNLIIIDDELNLSYNKNGNLDDSNTWYEAKLQKNRDYELDVSFFKWEKGGHSIFAEIIDNKNNKYSISSTFVIKKLFKPVITLQINKHEIVFKDSIDLSAEVFTNKSNYFNEHKETITFKFEDLNSSDNFERKGLLDKYTKTYIYTTNCNDIIEPGKYNVFAMWDGDEKTSSAISEPQIITIHKLNSTLELETSLNQVHLNNSQMSKISFKLEKSSCIISDNIPISLIVSDDSGNNITNININYETGSENFIYYNLMKSVNFTGKYSVKAQYAGNNRYFSTDSNEIEFEVNNIQESPDFVIIIQGFNYEDLESHYITLSSVYNTYKLLGFSDDDILFLSYYNYDNGIIDYKPTEDNIKNAFMLAVNKLEYNNGDLHVVMLGHGKEDSFPIDDEIMIPGELNLLLEDFESSLTNRKILLFADFCSSTTYFDSIKKNNRIIISSSSADSYHGLFHSNDVRNGSFFLSELFKFITWNYPLQEAFEFAQHSTEIYSSYNQSPGMYCHDSNFCTDLVIGNNIKQEPDFKITPTIFITDNQGEISLFFKDESNSTNNNIAIAIVDSDDENNDGTDEICQDCIFIESFNDYTQQNVTQILIKTSSNNKKIKKAGYKIIGSYNEYKEQNEWTIDTNNFENPGKYIIYYIDLDTNYVLNRTNVYKSKNYDLPCYNVGLSSYSIGYKDGTYIDINWDLNQQDCDIDVEDITYFILFSKDESFNNEKIDIIENIETNSYSYKYPNVNHGVETIFCKVIGKTDNNIIGISETLKITVEPPKNSKGRRPKIKLFNVITKKPIQNITETSVTGRIGGQQYTFYYLERGEFFTLTPITIENDITMTVSIISPGYYTQNDNIVLRNDNVSTEKKIYINPIPTIKRFEIRLFNKQTNQAIINANVTGTINNEIYEFRHEIDCIENNDCFTANIPTYINNNFQSITVTIEAPEYYKKIEDILILTNSDILTKNVYLIPESSSNCFWMLVSIPFDSESFDYKENIPEATCAFSYSDSSYIQVDKFKCIEGYFLQICNENPDKANSELINEIRNNLKEKSTNNAITQNQIRIDHTGWIIIGSKSKPVLLKSSPDTAISIVYTWSNKENAHIKKDNYILESTYGFWVKINEPCTLIFEEVSY